MVEYSIRITLNEPVCIATQKGVGNVIPTLDYIPGSTIRGAFADMWLQRNADKQPDGSFAFHKESDKKTFEKLFLSNDVIYGNCTIEQCRVIPNTARSCKYHKGFKSKKESHGVRNMLFTDALSALNAADDMSVENCHHPSCGDFGILEPFTGYYLESGGRLQQIELKKRHMARTRISEIFGIAHYGSLYTREALEAGQAFNGRIRLVDNNDADTLKKLLTQQKNVVHFGAAKSRSTGRARLVLNAYKPTWPDELNYSPEKRYDRLQQHFSSMSGCFWTLTALSDVIIRDNYLRYKSWIDIDDIRETVVARFKKNGANEQEIDATNKVLFQFELVQAWAAVKQVSGWQSSWKLPKFDQMAIAAGSVFLFFRQNPSELDNTIDSSTGKTEQDLFFQAMQSLEYYGMGERCNEGFGHVKFCDYFNLEETW